MKYTYVYALFLVLVFCTSCGGQNKADFTQDSSKSETKDILNSPRSNNPGIHTEYEYSDSVGKRLLIQNSFPRGGPYTDPNGKEYFKVIFWNRLINETENPLELKIDFPVDSFEVPWLIGKHYKILVPPDTMTIDKEPSYDYGLTGLKLFLDNNIHKPTFLKRTINPKESSGFYVVMLFDKGVGGPFRTGLSIKGQDLVYRISRLDSTLAHSLVVDKEIHCGSINLKNLMLRE